MFPFTATPAGCSTRSGLLYGKTTLGVVGHAALGSHPGDTSASLLHVLVFLEASFGHLWLLCKLRKGAACLVRS